jgi:hypothetical protein
MNTCGSSPYVTSSLTRGWVCRLHLLLVLASAPILRSGYCLRFETPPTWRTRSPYLYPPGTGWPRYTPRHWVPFSSPPITRRVTVEVFDPASTRDAVFFTTSRKHYTAARRRVARQWLVHKQQRNVTFVAT